MEMKQYYIQTRTTHGWHRIAPLPNYNSLEEAQRGLEKHLDSLFFEYGEMDIPTNIFRIVKCKPKLHKFQKMPLKPGYVITPSILDSL